MSMFSICMAFVVEGTLAENIAGLKEAESKFSAKARGAVSQILPVPGTAARHLGTHRVDGGEEPQRCRPVVDGVAS